MNGICLDVSWSLVRVSLLSDSSLPCISDGGVCIGLFAGCWSCITALHVYTLSVLCFIVSSVVYSIWCRLLRMVGFSWFRIILVVNEHRRWTGCSYFLSILSAMEALDSILTFIRVDVCRKCLELLEEVTGDQMIVVFYVAVEAVCECFHQHNTSLCLLCYSMCLCTMNGF